MLDPQLTLRQGAARMSRLADRLTRVAGGYHD